MSDTEVSNNSTIGSVVMEVNNTDAQNGDNECPVLETQPESNEENKEQDTENIGRENPSACHKSLCQICEENEADVAFKPCGHTVVCIGDLLLLVL